jgi:hypothetical protein
MGVKRVTLVAKFKVLLAINILNIDHYDQCFLGCKSSNKCKIPFGIKSRKRRKMGKGNITKLSDFDHAIIGFTLGNLDQIMLKSMARCECKSKGTKLPSCIISSL